MNYSKVPNKVFEPPHQLAKNTRYDYNTQGSYENYSYERQDTLPDKNYNNFTPQQPKITHTNKYSVMAEYVSAIPDPACRNFVSELAAKKITETHFYLEWVAKVMHQLAVNCPKFMDRLNIHLRSTNKMIECVKESFAVSTQNEMAALKTYISENGFASGFNTSFQDEIQFKGSFNNSKSVAQMLEEVRDLADYKHHVIMQKLVVQKF